MARDCSFALRNTHVAVALLLVLPWLNHAEAMQNRPKVENPAIVPPAHFVQKPAAGLNKGKVVNPPKQSKKKAHDAGEGAPVNVKPKLPPAQTKADTVQFLTEESALGQRVHNQFPVWHAPFPTLAQPWPLPQYIKSTNLFCRLDRARLSFQFTDVESEIVKEAVARTKRVIAEIGAVSISTPRMSLKAALNHAATASCIATSVKIKILHVGLPWPSLAMDESYRLEINNGGIFIWASESWGALRALETLTQVAWQTSPYTCFVNHTKILDHPRFPHRGFMIDTARHYLSVNTILKNLEAMAANKLNVLHWHMTDDQSFPFQSEVFPELSRKGAYDPEYRVYSKANIKEVVQYARLLGIRVIPEFDSPGHSYSWGKAFPWLLTECFVGSSSDGYYGPLNPARETTFEFLKKLFAEVISLFPDTFIHLGLDEIPIDCWSSNNEIKELIKTKGLRDVNDVKKYYVERLEKIVKQVGMGLDRPRRHIMWHEGAHTGAKLRKSSVVQVWMGQISDAQAMADQGHDVLFSACWYLDTMKHWRQAYECDLGRDGPWKKRMLGGETCMWAEKVSDNSMLQKAWPAASAAAERLWSHSQQDLNLAGRRLEEQRCRMLLRGIPVGVSSGPGGCPSFSAMQDLSSMDLNLDAEGIHELRSSLYRNQRLHLESFFYFISTVSCLTLLIILARSLRPSVPLLSNIIRTALSKPRVHIQLFIAVGLIIVSGIVVSRLLTSYSNS